LELGSDFGKVAGGRMAVCAVGLEEYLALFGVARNLIAARPIGLAIGSAVGRQFDLHLQKLRDAVDLGIGELGKTRHSRLRPSGFDHRTDGLVLLVMQHDDGAEQVGRLRSTRIVSVASCAVLFIKRSAFLGLRSIGGGAEAKKLASVCSAPTAAC